MISIPMFHGEIPNFDCWKSLEPSQIPTFPLVLPHFSWCFTRFHSFNVHKPGISPWRVPPPPPRGNQPRCHGAHHRRQAGALRGSHRQLQEARGGQLQTTQPGDEGDGFSIVMEWME